MLKATSNPTIEPNNKRFMNPSKAPMNTVTPEKPSLIRTVRAKVPTPGEAIPLPMTEMWRHFSDQVAREGVSRPQLNKGSRPPNAYTAQALGSPCCDNLDFYCGDIDCNFGECGIECAIKEEEEEENYDEDNYSTKAIPDGSLNARENVGEEEYLDPDLVNRAHPSGRVPYDIPKIVTIPSESSLDDAPVSVSLHGREKRVKHGLVEIYPGEFIRVHGSEHARAAVAKGSAIVVKCSVCHKRYKVDKAAKALYCPECESVTQLGRDKQTELRGKTRSEEGPTVHLLDSSNSSLAT